MPLVQTLDLPSPTAGRSGRWPKLKLSTQHKQLWDETRAALLWAVPSFADIWLGMMVDKDGELAWFTDKIKTCATDDKFFYCNPEFFFKLTLEERIFVACHEIAHAMYGHAGQTWILVKQGRIAYSDGVSLPVDAELLNEAADYMINDQLVQAKIGALPAGGLHWPALINGDMSSLDAYRLLYEAKCTGGSPGKRRSTDKSGADKGPGSGESFDELLEPGKGECKTPNKAISERSQSEWDTTIQAAMESAKLRGQLPANLSRIFTKRLQPKADWRDLYALAVSRKVGNDRYTWDRLEPQLAYRRIGVPGRTSFGCNLIVVAVDTSGSITQRTLEVFMAETVALLEQARPRRIILCQCDAEITEWMEIDAATDLYGVKLNGGGGTDFRPVFDRITRESESPDLMVYLTDAFGSFPQYKPSYPTIWGIVDNANPSVPFGEVVQIPAQHEG